MHCGPVNERVGAEIFLFARIWSQFAVLVAGSTAVTENREWFPSLTVAHVFFGLIGETENVGASFRVAVDHQRMTEKAIQVSDLSNS